MTYKIDAFTKKIAKHFQSARTKKEVSLRQVESESHVSYSYVSRFENGDHVNPTLAKLFALANAVDMNLHELFEELNQK